MNRTRDGLFFLSMLLTATACNAPIDSDPGPQPTSTTPPPALITPSRVTARWKPEAGASFTAVAAASAGDEGAVLFAESVETQSTLKLQRLDAKGATRGPAVVLGAVAAEYRQRVTLESDGERYLACWASALQITCTTVPVSEGDAAAAHSFAGASPALARHDGRVAIAYALPGALAVAELTSEGALTGDPTTFASDDASTFAAVTLLASTTQGFALVGGSPVQLHLLDATLLPLGAPIDLADLAWGFGAIAASGDRLAINLAKPYGSTTFFFEGATPLDSQEYGGGGKIGLRVALDTDGSSFGMLSNSESNSVDGGLLYRLLTPKNEATWAKALPDDQRSYDDAPCALVHLGGQPFFAVTQAYSSEELLIGKAPRP